MKRSVFLFLCSCVMLTSCTSIQTGSTSKYFIDEPYYRLTIDYSKINHTGLSQRSSNIDALKTSLSNAINRSSNQNSELIYKVTDLNINYKLERTNDVAKTIIYIFSIIPIPPFSVIRTSMILSYDVDYKIVNQKTGDPRVGNFKNKLTGGSSGQLFFRGKFSSRTYQALVNNSFENITNELFANIEKDIRRDIEKEKSLATN